MPEASHEGEEDRGRECQGSRVGRSRILQQAQAQMLLDAIDELVLGPEGWATVLQQNLQKLQSQDLNSKSKGHQRAVVAC